ncbi:integrator complex subunit 10-like isoform X2 [Orbicella faveolata]|uniref:integrator complex subunit 10-like isoform X2 n=1 Tax=Orbicella faveolata TaxID=48498 RepID=UPI0009E1ECCF|nr:integrator complex subunit 10-like isoform X2 [Orbicella faveolata]
MAAEEDVTMADVDCSTQWLVERARQSLKENNPYEAKAWLITAKTLYPKDFGLQYEAYTIERNAERVQESANLFYIMFEQFPDSNILWKEVASFTDALESEVTDQHGKFLTDMFSSLPQHAQREILLKAAGRCKDCIEKCRMMLLLMRRFPDVIPKNGVALTEMLIDAENSEYPDAPVNPYRKLLVCDVLPHLLASDNMAVDTSSANGSQDDEDCAPGISLPQVYKWLELSIHFYVSCATAHNFLSENSDAQHGIIDTSIVAEVLDGKGPWVALHELFYLTAQKCGWAEICRIHDRLDPKKYRSSNDHWASISELHYKLKRMSKHSLEEGTEEEMIEKTGVMFAAIILFLQTVWEYCRVVNRLDLVSSSGLVFPLVLIEDSVNENHQSSASSNSAGGGSNSPAPKKKKRKLASGRPGSPGKDDSKNKQPANIIIDKNCGSVSQNLSDDFIVSVEAWHLLNTHTDYKNDFTRLLDEWEVDQWNWMGTFEVDRLIYKGKYKKAVEFLQEQKRSLEKDASANQESLIRGAIQLSCSYFHLDDHKKACEEALYALNFFSSRASPGDNMALKRSSSIHQGKLDKSANELSILGSSHSGRCLRLIQCSETEVLSLTVGLLLSSLKQRLATGGRNDTLLGHLIVLLQFGWPREEGTFYELLDKIRDQGGLKYRVFFNYVNNIDILEEFAHLYSDDTFNLDLVPHSTTGSSRAVTRGVNKGAKEDFRAALERQVARSDDSFEPLLRAFFQNERESLILS